MATTGANQHDPVFINLMVWAFIVVPVKGTQVDFFDRFARCIRVCHEKIVSE